MYCPRCSQERITVDLKFCSRCGLSLELVSDVVDAGGAPDRFIGVEESSTIFTKRNGLIFSVIWDILMVLGIIALTVVFDLQDDEITVLIISAVILSILLPLASLCLKSGKVKTAIKDLREDYQTMEFSQSSTNGALSPKKSQSAHEYAASADVRKRFEKNDLVSNGTVTEETTKLLKRKKLGVM